MSNPSINRWGKNLFWYRFWYTDKNNALVIHQDEVMNKLILLYIHYGLLYPQNIFVNKYWYFNTKINFQKSWDTFNTKYFRLIEYKNRIVNEYKSYKIRNKVKNLYFSKIWIMRYQNWLVLNFYCYQPLTTKLKRKKKFFNKELSMYTTTTSRTPLNIKRYKLFFFYSLINFFKTDTYYTF